MKRAISVLACLVFSSIILFASNVDRRIYIDMDYVIEENSSGELQLSAKEITSNTYVSKRSLSDNRIIIPQNFFYKVNDIKLEFGNNTYTKSSFMTLLPQYQDVFINDDTLYSFYLPGNLLTGSKYRLEVKKDFNSVEYCPVIEIPNYNYLGHYNITFTTPKDIEIEFETVFTREEYPYNFDKKVEGDKIIWSLNFEKIDYASPLSYFDENDYHAYIVPKIKKNGKYINPVDPTSIVDWYSGLTSIHPRLEDKDKNILKAELAGCSNNYEKVNLIYDFIRNNYRYITIMEGNSAIVPANPSEVLGRYYGDCKERASLLSAIAAANDIKIDLALVSSDKYPAYQSALISKYNHMICAFEYNDSLYLFDPTASFAEFGTPGDHLYGHEILILDEINPRAFIYEKRFDNYNIEVNINASGSMEEAETKVKISGALADYISFNINKTPMLEIENYLSSILGESLYKVSINSFSDIEYSYGNLLANCLSNVENFVITTPANKYIPKTIFRPFHHSIIKRLEDTYPVLTDVPVNMKVTIMFDKSGFIPTAETFTLGSELTPVEFKAEIIEQDEKNITIAYEMIQKKFYLSNPERNIFLNLYREYLSSKNNLFTMKSGGVK